MHGILFFPWEISKIYLSCTCTESRCGFFHFGWEVLRLGPPTGTSVQAGSEQGGQPHCVCPAAPSASSGLEGTTCPFGRQPYGLSVEPHGAVQCRPAKIEQRSYRGQDVGRGTVIGTPLHLASIAPAPAYMGHFIMAMGWGMGTELGRVWKSNAICTHLCEGHSFELSTSSCITCHQGAGDVWRQKCS